MAYLGDMVLLQHQKDVFEEENPLNYLYIQLATAH